MDRLNVEVRLRSEDRSPASMGWVIGSVERRYLTTLLPLSPRLALKGQSLDGERLILSVENAHELEIELELLNRWLFGLGVWSRWRDERLALWVSDWSRALGTIERSAARFWGVWTEGAHCNGYVCNPSGRPERLWIARRAASRPVDPGLLDNLIGCGVAATESPQDAMLRESWEEAGLQPECLRGIRAAAVRDVIRVTEGDGLHRQRIHIFDLALDRQLTPVNQDGEVDSFSLMSIGAVIRALAAGQFAADAAFVTRDFLVRHGLD